MVIKKSVDETQQYIKDAANFKGICDAVFLPETVDDVIKILTDAEHESIGLTICGNHTSLTGSSIPIGGWVLSTERLNRILEINLSEEYAVVEPGITLKQFQEVLRADGYFFPPDPTEHSCFLGGMISTNASGAKSFKYGSTRRYVEELEVVLSGGEIVTVRRGAKIEDRWFSLIVNKNYSINFEIPASYVMPGVKNTAGYYFRPNMDIIDVFIGSEGTLGIITKIKVRIKKAPERNISFLVFFKNVQHALSFLDAQRILSKGKVEGSEIGPTTIEFFDEKALKLLTQKFPNIPESADCAVMFDQEIDTNTSTDAILNSWDIFFEKQQINLEDIWIATDERDVLRFVHMRHTLPVLVNDLVLALGMKKIGTDIAVPKSVFNSFYQKAIEKVKAHGIDYVAFGHFGDCHLHLNLLPKDSEQITIANKLYNYLCTESIKCGGTFSAEHGVGKLKKDYLYMMHGSENMQFMQNVKRKFDPAVILNNGNLFM